MTLSAVVALGGLLLAGQATGPLTGRVVFAGQGVPGATVIVSQGARIVSATTDQTGTFQIAVPEPGVWNLRVQMRGFAPLVESVTVPLPTADLTLTLTMQAFAEIVGHEAGPATVIAPPPPAAPGAAGVAHNPDDPSIVNGTAVNGAATPFAQARAFGNNRPQLRAPYSVGMTALLGNSAWNARPYAFGESTQPTPAYNDANVTFNLTGPIKVPWLVSNGPQMSLAYQHSLLHNATTASAIMPTAAERAGDFSALTGPIIDPQTGLPFPRNVIPADRLSGPAEALLAYYPLPNAATTVGANFEEPLVSATTNDGLQFATSKMVTNRTTIGGSLAWQRSVVDSESVFAFADASRQSTLNGVLTVTRRLTSRTQVRFNYQVSRTANGVTPFFAGRTNVSGEAGIIGNDQNPEDWGPPTLLFPDVAGLTDQSFQQTVQTKQGGGAEVQSKRGTHNLTFGGDARWNGTDLQSSQNPRGTLAFTGAATGNAFADFLLGLPTTSAIATGTTASRLRAGSYDAYFTDDWRLAPGLTVNLGLRWEYEAPYTEASGDLANLDVAPDFSAVAPVVATHPVGAITGQTFPASLLRPDKRGFEPRLAGSWRPILGSSLVIRTSYALYRMLGVYQPLAVLLTQEPPVSRTVSVESTPESPLTLANPFPASLPASATFAVDPNFRPGLVHSWTLSAQRDLAGSLTVIAAYFGDRGDHLMQAFLPNTYPAGAVNPCPTCPSGFVYVTSTGQSLRNAGQFTLRRRLHAGLMTSVQYTLSKSTDDAATFSNTALGPTALSIAQDWLNLSAERGPSSFDQRHLVAMQVQYTTGVGVTGGTLIDGFWGRLVKDWTVTSQLTAGSGLPLTPIVFEAVAGTGVVGVRPSLTGAPLAPTTPGAYVNPAAFAVPASGTWGDAGRDSIRGPATFGLDLSVARAFRLTERVTLEWHVMATNVLNRVTFASIGTVVGSAQFGLPTLANAMRQVQTSFRLSF